MGIYDAFQGIIDAECTFFSSVDGQCADGFHHLFIYLYMMYSTFFFFLYNKKKLRTNSSQLFCCVFFLWCSVCAARSNNALLQLTKYSGRFAHHQMMTVAIFTLFLLLENPPKTPLISNGMMGLKSKYRVFTALPSSAYESVI